MDKSRVNVAVKAFKSKATKKAEDQKIFTTFLELMRKSSEAKNKIPTSDRYTIGKTLCSLVFYMIVCYCAGWKTSADRKREKLFWYKSALMILQNYVIMTNISLVTFPNAIQPSNECIGLAKSLQVQLNGLVQCLNIEGGDSISLISILGDFLSQALERAESLHGLSLDKITKSTDELAESVKTFSTAVKSLPKAVEGLKALDFDKINDILNNPNLIKIINTLKLLTSSENKGTKSVDHDGKGATADSPCKVDDELEQLAEKVNHNVIDIINCLDAPSSNKPVQET